MTRRDHIIKWLMYALALVPVLALDLYILPWFPLFGVVPSLLPVAAIAAAVLEGPTGGAAYGMYVGILSDALIPGVPGAMTLGLSLLGLAAGVLARYRLRQNLLGCLVCSAGALAVIDLVRGAAWFLRGRASLPALLAVIGPEILWSLVFLPFVYAIYRWVFRHVPKPSLI